jgi:hypothetical protein
MRSFFLKKENILLRRKKYTVPAKPSLSREFLFIQTRTPHKSDPLDQLMQSPGQQIMVACLQFPLPCILIKKKKKQKSHSFFYFL